MVSRPRGVALLVLVVVLGSTVVPVVGLGPTEHTSDPTTDHRVHLTSGYAVASTGIAQVNNSTNHHANPANISIAGDLPGVRDWLSNRLLERLTDGAVELDQGQYERAQSLLGDEFGARFEQFVDVIGETDTESDDDNDEPYRTVHENQEDLTETVETYDETYDSYEEAVDEGNETAVRQHARRLQRLNERVQRHNRTVVGGYRTLENQTGADLEEAVTSVENVSEDIATRQDQIDQDLFTATELVVSPEATTISYTDPLVVEGQLLTDAGEPVANRSVRIQVYTRTRTVQTDANGEFTLQYRPRTVPINQSSIGLEYLPRNSSEFLASNATVEIDVEQVRATLSFEQAPPTTVAFGDQVATAARLELDGEPIAGMPLRAAIGSTPLDRGSTGESGTVTLGSGLPAAVLAGDQAVTVAVGVQDRAVTAEPISQSVTVQPTATNLTVRGDQSGAAELTIDGQLTAVDGDDVADQPVQVTVGEVQRTVRTGSDGTYTLRLTTARLDGENNASVPVTVQFEGQGTNLNASSATTQVSFRGSTADAGGEGPGGIAGVIDPGQLPDEFTRPLAGVAALGVLLLVLAALVVRRRTASSKPGDDGETDDAVGAEDDEPDSQATAETESNRDDGDGLDFTPGKTFLREGDPGAAVRYTYQHLRGYVGPQFGARESDTHWEFFNRCREQGLDESRAVALRQLVETYERMEFHPRPVDADVASLIDRLEAQWRATDPAPSDDEVRGGTPSGAGDD